VVAQADTAGGEGANVGKNDSAIGKRGTTVPNNEGDRDIGRK
jgi:hypothetical protein